MAEQASAANQSKTLGTIANVLESAQAIAERTITSQSDIARLTLEHAKENTNDFFSTVQAMASHTSLAQASLSYWEYLTEFSRKQGRRAQTLADAFTRTGRAAWPPMNGASVAPKP
ncbi:phasin family protein [Glacieibacterium megasporae]|uniref:phasin family protein n=1 Tax=Glacieibacterium megasporae TaxID=2835787 RepID=UPI001C1E6DCC|nr:phasin family protein [Polymorphobacter megasporae]UAJ12558.1 phasin family protein [Polymorphobacter megasporae]